MTRRAPLPMITECVEKEKKKKGLSRAQLLRAAYPFFVICLLCLAHIHLQFARRDVLMQHGQLQGQRAALLRQEQKLARENEALCDPAALKLRARRDLNMQEVEVQTADIFTAIPADIKEKYNRPLTPTASDRQVAELRRNGRQQGLPDVLFSLFDSGTAIASPALASR